MKKMFTLIASCFLLSGSLMSQTIGMVGLFTEWGTNPDIVMTTLDNENYSATAIPFAVTGGMKFRQDSDWAVNWGGADFPMGVAVSGGSDIPVPAGTYDVTFNIVTGDYNFTAAATGYSVVNLVGGFAPAATSLELATADGINYFRDNVPVVGNNVNIEVVGGSTYGGSGLVGMAVANASAIPVADGYYNVIFNKNTLAYAFSQVSVGLIGTAIPPYDWSVDVDMVSTDGGVTFKLDNYAVLDGVMKFRANDGWGTNWGEYIDDGIEVDTVFAGGNDIAVTAGTYDITFNRYTGIFCVSPTACVIAEGFPAGLGLNEMETAINSTVSPNPTDGILTINMEGEILSTEIFDMAGKVIFTSKSKELNVSNLEVGTYIYKISTEKGNSFGKFVKK